MKLTPAEKLEVGSALSNWRTLNEMLMDLTEAQVREALKREQGSIVRRGTFVKRLTQRLVAIETEKARQKLN